MKNAVYVAVGLAVGVAGTLYSNGTSDLNDDGSVDLQDFSTFQAQFTGPLNRNLVSFTASLPQPIFTPSIPGVDRFVVRTIVASDGTFFEILEDGQTVFAYDADAAGGNYVPQLVFPPDGALVLTPGAELSITGSSGVTIMGYFE